MLYSLLNVTPWYILWDWSGDCEEDGPRKSLQFSHSVLSDSLRPMNCNKPGFLIHHQLPELAQTHVIKLVMPSNHLILFHPLIFLPSIFPSIRVFSSESALHIRWPKYWSFSFSISPSNEYSGLIFPVVMYGCESWTTKKAENWRTDAFELWFWKRLLRVPWTARKSNQSILKEISPENSLEGLLLKLKLQYFGHLMRRTDSLEKTLMLGKSEGRRRRDDRGWDGWMASPTRWTWVWVNSGSWWWTGRPGVLQSMGSQS